MALPAGWYRIRGQRFLRAGLWLWVLLPIISRSGYAFDPPSAAGWLQEIRIGVAAHDVDGLWSGESKEPGTNIGAEAVFSHTLFHLLGATANPNAGVSLNTQGDTSCLYGGFLLRWNQLAPFAFATGFGIAVHNGERDTDAADRKSLGSQVLFRVPIQIGYALTAHHWFTLAFDHVSNGYLASPNDGMDTLGVFYGYRF
jgi:hypothetical protein